MPRLSMNELTTYKWSFDEDLYHYRQAGYEAIGLWRRKLTDFGVERGLELLEESGLAVSNVMWAGGFTGNDGRTLEQSITDAIAAIDLAAAVNARSLVLYTGGRNNHTVRHANRLMATAIDAILPHAVTMGVTLAIEPMHPACAGEWTFLTSLSSTLKLLQRYQSPRLKLVYDTYHFPSLKSPAAGDSNEAETRQMLANLVSQIAVVHLGDLQEPHSHDQERLPLGEGTAAVAQTVRTLIEAGYDGDFDVELMGPAIEMSDYHQLLTQSRQAFAEMTSPVLSQ